MTETNKWDPFKDSGQATVATDDGPPPGWERRSGPDWEQLPAWLREKHLADARADARERERIEQRRAAAGQADGGAGGVRTARQSLDMNELIRSGGQ